MESKTQLLHPAGKHNFRIDTDKYEVMSEAIIHCLQKQPLMHKEMLEEINDYFKKKKINFEGAVEWYMEGVKLDLEARKMVKRIKDGSKLKFQLTSK